jgi:hypothetical protein
MFLCSKNGGLSANRHKMFQRIAFSIETWELRDFEVWWNLSIP